MKNFKLSLIAASLLLIGCGGGGSGGSSSKLTSIETVDDAKTSYKAMSSFNTIDISKVNSGYSKLSHKLQKTETESVECYNGGSIDLDRSDDSKTIKISYNDCTGTGEKYRDGSVEVYAEDDNHIVITFTDYTTKDVGGEEYADIVMKLSVLNDITTLEFDGVMNQTSKNKEVNNISFDNLVLVSKKTYSESWSTMDGGINLESKCVTGNYKFSTKEKLVGANDGTGNIESGILDINGATYTFKNENVTIETASDKETLPQSDFREEIKSSSCDI